MEVSTNVEEACRLCLNGEGRISVFEERISKCSITPENIYDCVSVKITKEDLLPKGICENCLLNVENWCAFKSTCERTQETLNRWLTNNTLNPELHEDESVLKDPVTHKKAENLLESNLTFSNSEISDVFDNVTESDVNSESSYTLGKISCEATDKPHEPPNASILEEENKASSFVKSSKDFHNSSKNFCSSKDEISFNDSCSEIENVQSHNGGLTKDLEKRGCEDDLKNVQNSNIVNPKEVSRTLEKDERILTLLVESDTLPTCEVKCSSSNEIEAMNLDDSFQSNILKESTSDVKLGVNKDESMEISNIEIEKVLESGNRGLEKTEGLSGDQVSIVSADIANSLKNNINQSQCNKLPGDESHSGIPSKEVESKKNEASHDSDKENSTPNSSAISEMSKDKTIKVSDSAELMSDSDQKLAEGEPHSYPELRIESISSLSLDPSDFFTPPDGKTSSDINNAVSENTDENNTPENTNENVSENSDKNIVSETINKNHLLENICENRESETTIQSAVSENTDSIAVSDKIDENAASDSIRSLGTMSIDRSASNKEVNEISEKMGSSSSDLSSILTSDKDAVMEVDTVETNDKELPTSEKSAARPDNEVQFCPLVAQNIKQEPVDSHETASSSNTDNIFPIRVKSEFSAIDYDDDNYIDTHGSISGDVSNKCDICNRKYSSLSNYLKHLQTKVHLYNVAQLSGGENSPTLLGENMAYLNDSRLNYSNDSYSEDSRLSGYSGDSPMLRSRLEELAQVSPNKFQLSGSRQALPKLPNRPSLSKLPKTSEKCKLCNTNFSYISEMRRHLLSKKHKDNELLMQDNEEMMRENERLVRDSERMMREKERYLRERSLISSKKKEEELPPQPLEKKPSTFICPIDSCNFSCQKGIRLLTHMRTHGIGQPSAPLLPQFPKEVDSIMPKPKLSLRQQELLKKDIEKRKSNIISENMGMEPLLYDYKCEGCSKSFLKEAGLRKHMYYCSALRSEQPEEEEEEEEEDEEEPKSLENNADNLQIKKMHCPICNLTFAAKSVFISHVQIYHKGSALESGLFRPKKTLIASNKLRIKSRKGHGYVCNHCGKKFNLLSSLNFHLKVHSTKHICKICKKGYDSRRAFMDHCRLHFLPPGSKQTLCHKCFRVFKTRGEFYYHRKNDMCSIKLKIYTCNICQHSFKDPNALEDHKSRFHNDMLDISDDEMNVPVNQRTQIPSYLSLNRQHLDQGIDSRPGTSSKSHFSSINSPSNLPKTDPFLHCDVCDRDYATLSSLKKHMWKYHQTKPLLTRRLDVARKNNVLQANVSKCWKCKHCKKVLNNRRMLVVHLKKCKYNAFELEEGMCLQCGKWCESGKSRICRFCLPDINKIPKPKLSLPPSSNFSLTPKLEFHSGIKQEPNSAPARVLNHQLKLSLPKIPPPEITSDGIRLMKCPVGAKYFRSELLMIKHYSQCDGTCENRCSHCRKLFNSSKEYRIHLLNSNCYGSNRSRSKNSRLSLKTLRSLKNLTESKINIKTENLPVKNNDDLDSSGEMGLADSSSISEEGSAMEMDPALANDPANKIMEEKSIKIGRVCTICNKVITMQRGVYRHVYGCFKIAMLTQESVSCKKCSRTFSKHLSMKENTAAIREHILSCHYIPYYEGEGLMEDGSPCESAPPLLCYVCSFGFSCNESLRRHIMEHRSRKDEVNNIVLLLEAEMLSEKILNSDSVSYHIKIQPESTKALSTQPVVKRNVLSFKVPGSLSLDSRKVIRKKLLECEKCSRKFTNRNKFLRHKKVHGIVTQSVFHEVSENYLNYIIDHTPPSSS